MRKARGSSTSVDLLTALAVMFALAMPVSWLRWFLLPEAGWPVDAALGTACGLLALRLVLGKLKFPTRSTEEEKPWHAR